MGRFTLISVFHTTKIIITDPTKFSFTGSILESMYAGVSKESIIMNTYKEFCPSGLRELTAEMVQSIHDADKPAARGKNQKNRNLRKRQKGRRVLLRRNANLPRQLNRSTKEEEDST